MPARDRQVLMRLLQTRFAQHAHRHAGVSWADVQLRLESNRQALAAVGAMEDTGGEPDVIGTPDPAGRVTFVDCSAETPSGRRSLCYDGAALTARRHNTPKGSALDLAATMGVQLLDEDEYRTLQLLGEFDSRTSSWIRTPTDVRARGGALFCDRRYGRVFVYHNGAESYYAARGFRGLVRV